MAIKYLDARRIRGLSSDTKPTNVPSGTIFEETNTYSYVWWNGTAWLPLGISSNVILFGGNNETEIWNGTTWTESGNTNITTDRCSGNGNITDAITINGYEGGASDKCETWNGSGWTNIDDTSTATRDMGNSSGANSSNGLCVSGRTGGVNELTVRCEQRGTGNWSADADIGTATMVSAGGGGNTDCIHIGGQRTSGNYRRTETALFNGTSWNNGGDTLTAGRQQHGGDGDTSSAIVTGGDNYLVSTEEFNGLTWSAGGNAIIGRSDGVVAGTPEQAMLMGGYGNSTAQITTENYIGNVWASGTDTNENFQMATGGMV